MKTILSLLFVASLTWLTAQDYARCKIFTDAKGLQKLAELGVAVDHGTTKHNTFFISDFSLQERNIMIENGFQFEVLIPDVTSYYVNRNKGNQPLEQKNGSCNSTTNSGFSPNVPTHFNLGSMAGYYTYQEFLNELDEMAATYPNLITVKAPISTFQTVGNRPIYYVKISDNPATDEAEPEVLYSAVHHAREPASLSQLIFYMWYLLENYSSSEEVAFLLNNTEMYFVPMVNPDGYVYNETTNPAGGGMWRKNRHSFGANVGVDNNRNYSYGWNTTGVSPTASGETYPGTSAFSEPENQAMKWFCENRDFQFAFNAHTYANDILFPIGTTTAEFAVDHDYFNAFTGYMVKYNGYTNMKSSTLYPASGDSDDYMYKVDLDLKPRIFAMTPEIGNNNDGFWPAQSRIIDICKDMMFPNLMLSHLTHRFFSVDDSDPSTIETMTGNFNHSVARYGQEDGDVIVSITPLQGIQSVGNPITYNLAIMGTQTGAIAYTLNPSIQFGDVIKYVLNTNLNGWIRHDTITKSFGALTLQISEDATATTNWTGNFSTTTSTFVSPSTSFTDSPTGNYSSNATKTYMHNNTIDLTNASAAGVRFYAKWDLEADYDYARMEVSTDNGSSWIGQCGLYTNAGTAANGSVQPDGEPVYDGVQSEWVLEEINLSDYLGQTIKIRFILESDNGTVGDGFYFDDFTVSFNEIIDNTGIVELTNTLKTVPNPANEQVYISFGNPIQDGQLCIFDQTGKQVAEKRIYELTNKVAISTKELPQGIYYVRYETQGIKLNPTKMVVIH
jgi:carboxypeptidase T